LLGTLLRFDHVAAAVTGKISTKADVFSFGVVLLELITGTTAIDDSRVGEGEETRHLAYWFSQIRKDAEQLRAAIDPALDVGDGETLESIGVIAELAGHCTAREPSQRPDMGHAVNVLVPMVEKWRPVKDEAGHRPAPAAAADGEELAGRGGRRPDGRRRERHEPGRQQGQHPRPPRRLRRVLHLGRRPVIGSDASIIPSMG
jgi:hypothetical protein